jgi:hypothetical protein
MPLRKMVSRRFKVTRDNPVLGSVHTKLQNETTQKDRTKDRLGLG